MVDERENGKSDESHKRGDVGEQLTDYISEQK
jgi:hypothetical protein